MKRTLFAILSAATLAGLPLPAAERFDEITITPQTLVAGETHHGYREMRVIVQNDSAKDPCEVRLTYPDQSYGPAKSLRRASRTVSVGPESAAVVSFWLPPLPVMGNAIMSVETNGETAGVVSVPDVRHCVRQGTRYGGPARSAVILVSRNLDFDDLTSKLKFLPGTRQAYSAAMATGSADARGRRGMVANAWTPDTSSSGPHWLEVDYSTPMVADRVRIYETVIMPHGGHAVLTGVSGSNVARIAIPPHTGVARPSVRELAFLATPEPVKTVRLEFPSSYAGSLSIDAVEIAGPSGSAWAGGARASSEGTASYRSGTSVPDSREVLRSEIHVSDWSPYWLSYTPFDAVMISGAEFKSLGAGAQNALWRYAEAGGNLVVLGGAELPAPWNSFAKIAGGQARRFAAGLGSCFVFESGVLPDQSSPGMRPLFEALDGSARNWDALPDETSANSMFPVVKNSRIPVRGTVFIMLCFVILIGPVNMIVLSRMNRRTWLLWTVPAISFVTCLVVFAYSLLREGVSPNTRIEGFTVLDQVSRRASSFGYSAFYCPLTPSQGLFFGSETEATPLMEVWEYRRHRGGEPQREIDWTQAQRLYRGWVSARVPAHFLLRKSEVRRERLQLEHGGRELGVVNGLGAAIRNLWLVDASGRLYEAAGIPAGEKAVLKPVSENSRAENTRTAPAGAHPIAAALEVWQNQDKTGELLDPALTARSMSAHLVPGTYIVELAENPFIENGLGTKARPSRTRTSAFVYGILDSPAQP